MAACSPSIKRQTGSRWCGRSHATRHPEAGAAPDAAHYRFCDMFLLISGGMRSPSGCRQCSREKDAVIGRTPLAMTLVLNTAADAIEGAGRIEKVRLPFRQATPERL